MGEKKHPRQLGSREREILEIVFRLGEASVGDVIAQMAEPPAYDSVRTMLRLLESKKLVKHRQEGTKYIYRPTQSKSSVSKSALSHLMATFFENSVEKAFAAILGDKGSAPTDEELARVQKMIAKARQEGR